MDNIFADNAPKYFERGKSVIPVYRASKKPAISGWTRYCQILPTEEEFESWLKKYADCNIGICLGPASGLMAIDFDKGPLDKEQLVLAALPPTPCVKKGKKGWTAFYPYNSDIKSTRIETDIEIDILSVGRQTVLPPSIHPETGRPYEWIGWPGGIRV